MTRACYFDDIIIPSKSLEQQCERLSAVLSRFRQHNLRVKASKCTFGATNATCHGHVVCSQGVHTDPQKVQAVSSISEPTTVEQVRSFLGLQDFIDTLYLILPPCPIPLFNLPKRDRSFHGGTNSKNLFCCSKDTYALLLF